MLSALFQSIPDQQAVLDLIRQFDKLIRKYANCLDYDDAYNDLRLFFIELITEMSKKDIGKKEDGIIVKYIVTSLKNQYIKISKETKRKPILFSDLSDEQLYHINEQLSYSPQDSFDELLPYKPILTKSEKKVLILVYVKGIPVSQIAKEFGESRQAVNQTKMRAIRKLLKQEEQN